VLYLRNVGDGATYLRDGEVFEGEGPEVQQSHRHLQGSDVQCRPRPILLS
jgi:hypothetical protein